MQRRAIFAAGFSIAALAQFQAGAQPAPPALAYRPHRVAGSGGATLAVQEYGNALGTPILLIHGYMQSNLSWARQVMDPALLREFRLVTLDLRGHGMSDKPVGDEHYKPGKVWADDIAAVIRTLGLARPVLVGWSYAGRVMGDYITEHGTAGIGGLNYVGAVSSSADATRFGRAGRHIGPNTGGSEDLTSAIRGTIAFLRECFEIQPDTGDFEMMLAFNMMMPRHVRLSAAGRPANYETQLRALDVPCLVTHGVRDKAVDITMGRYTAATARGARLSEYENIGHAPFWEDAPRFNRELAEFARTARR